MQILNPSLVKRVGLCIPRHIGLVYLLPMQKISNWIVGAMVFGAISCQSPEAVSNNFATDARVANGETLQEFMPLDSLLFESVDSGLIPGGAMLVVRDGLIIHNRSYGYSNPLDSILLEPDAIYRICSQSKALTATAAMVLWEKGLLGLDDPVSKYIPSIEQMGVLDSLYADTTWTTIPNETTMTVRHLMTHTSGLSYGEIGGPVFNQIYQKMGVVDLFTMGPISVEENSERIARTALVHEPGERWMYGLGLDVLGRVIEVASGMTFDEFLRAEVLEPLGMNDTHFYLPEALSSRLVPVMEPHSDGGWKIHEHPLYNIDYPMSGARAFYGGGAGLSSTPLDYAKFLQMYLNKGVFNGHRILLEATVDTIMADHAPGLLENSGWNQGLAFGVQNEAGEANGASPAGTFFWGGYFNTTYAADPSTGTIGIFMKQTYGVNDASSGQFTNLVFQR
jgi:CubicO group peptidase (beta-lactamase class C family)